MSELLAAIVTTPVSAVVSGSGAVHDALGTMGKMAGRGAAMALSKGVTLAEGAAKGVIAAGHMVDKAVDTVGKAAKAVDKALHLSEAVDKAGEVTGQLADRTAEVGLSITAFAAKNIEKGAEVLPTGLHTLSAVFLRMPMGPMLVATVLLSMTVSVYGSRYIDRLMSWNTWPLRHIRFMKGHDAGFAATYVISTTMALIMLFAISMISMRVQIPLLMAVGASIIGVVGSVSVDTIMSAADPEGLREEEKMRTPQTSRRVYLHGSMALLSAFLAYGIFIARA